MLVPSMKPGEITKEVKRDHETILSSTILRLGEEYNRERKKLQIDKTRTYSKEYCIRTASKNNWIIILRKRPSFEKYDGTSTLSVGCFTYYYNDTGIKVFNCTDTQFLLVYNGHFFSRYNERLSLNLSQPLDIVKHFARYNSFIQHDLAVKDGKEYMIGYCHCGITLGEVDMNNFWVQHKTFVSRELMRNDQTEEEQILIEKMQKEIDLWFKPVTGTKTETKINNLKAINGHNMD